jgi:hypothetical protein
LVSRIGLTGVLLTIIAFLSGVIVVQQIAIQKPESTSLGLAEAALIAVFASAVSAIVQFILARSASTTRIVTNEGNFKELQTAVEDNYEVLDRSTIKAWRQKKTSHVLAPGSEASSGSFSISFRRTTAASILVA